MIQVADFVSAGMDAAALAGMFGIFAYSPSWGYWPSLVAWQPVLGAAYAVVVIGKKQLST
jgi:hypothetical protein